MTPAAAHRLRQRPPAGPGQRPRRFRRAPGEGGRDRGLRAGALRRRRAGGDCRGRLRRPLPQPRPDRHARAPARAGPRAQGDHRHRRPRGGGRRRHQRRLHAQHQAGDRRRGAGRVRAAARARGQGGQGLPLWRRHPRPGGDPAHRDGDARRGRGRGLLRRRPAGGRQPGDAARAELRPHLRPDREPACRGPLAHRLRLHGGGRGLDPPRPAGHSRRIGDRGGRARHPPGRAHGRALPRRPYLHRRRAGGGAPRQAGGPAGHLRGGPAPFRADRPRCRRLPHLCQDGAAAQERGQPSGDGGGAQGRHHRRHRQRPRAPRPGEQARADGARGQRRRRAGDDAAALARALPCGASPASRRAAPPHLGTGGPVGHRRGQAQARRARRPDALRSRRPLAHRPQRLPLASRTTRPSTAVRCRAACCARWWTAARSSPPRARTSRRRGPPRSTPTSPPPFSDGCRRRRRTTPRSPCWSGAGYGRPRRPRPRSP